MPEIIVIALGGNAIMPKGEKASIKNQFKNTEKAVENIAKLAQKSPRIVLTHGNGPQVGNILIRVEESLGKAYSIPLEVAVAESEGEIGYILGQALRNEFAKKGISKPIVSILTQVLVDKNDPMFRKPTKFVGPFYSEKQAVLLKKKGLKVKKDSNRGWRRVVPSPKPLKIVEVKIIKKLVEQKVIVIAAGGGGIPVYKSKNILKGIEAVIDKDLASACLATSIKAGSLIILTGVKKVYLNYSKKNQKPIKKMNVKQAKKFLSEGHFPEGSMGPKIRASINFLEGGGKKVLITSPKYLLKALKGKEGTWLTK